MPDALQKGIIDKTVEDREEREEEEKNESFSITRRQLRGIIAELGIDRMTSGDNDPRLDDPDDLTTSLYYIILYFTIPYIFSRAHVS